jgi:opacity protein-like surface antigen
MRILRHLFVFTLAVTLFFPTSSIAQDEKPPEEGSSSTTGGFGYFAMSGQQFKLAPLNILLEQHGYPTFEDKDLAFGGGGFFVLNNILIGGEGHSLREQTIANKNYELSLSLGSGSFNLGYLFLNNDNFSLYSYARIGGSTVDVTITNKNAAVSMTDIIQQPNQSAHLSKQSFLATPVVGFIYKPTSGLFLGLQAGYNIVYMQRSWKVEDTALDEGPSTHIGGPFLRLTLGGGGF